MEVVQGTEADRKGGHIARRRADGAAGAARDRPDPARGGGVLPRLPPLALLQHQQPVGRPARCSPSTLERGGGVLELPLIVNPKTVDPRDPDSPAVIQLESAMGAAIGSFPGARLVLRPAHAVRAGQDDRRPAGAALGRLRPDRRVPRRAGPTAERLPYVELDSRFYRLLDDFEPRFPAGPPSLREAGGWWSMAMSPSAPA